MSDVRKLHIYSEKLNTPYKGIRSLVKIERPKKMIKILINGLFVYLIHRNEDTIFDFMILKW